MDLTITVCDVDLKQGRDTKRYTLRQGDREVTVDLCEEHSEPIEALFGNESRAQSEADSPEDPKEQPVPASGKQAKRQPGEQSRKKPAARRRRGPGVVSLEEIEASKKR